MVNRLLGFLVVGLALGFVGCGGDSLTIPPTTGTLAIVTTTTEGPDADPDGYTVQVDALSPQTIGSAATLQVPELAPGPHSIVLTGLAANCAVAENPRTVNVVVGETTTATFAVTCGATTGALLVTTQTNGPSPDADGYTISLDGTETGVIVANGSVTLGNLTPGSHVVGLGGIAANCHMEGENLRAITIAPGQTATVTFTVTCAEPPPTVGVLRITTTTTGSDQDANGYAFAVDGGANQPIGTNTAASLDNISVGSHTVVLSNVAPNCTVADGASRDVNVSPGGTTTVAFSVTCTALPPTVGSIHVTTTTDGEDQDPDGYAVKLDGGAGQPIDLDGQLLLSNVSLGSHTVELTGVAGNCTVDDASKDVTVSAGATAEVGFSITCTAIPPSASKSTLSVSTDNIAAGTGSSTVTVTVKDADGNPLSGVLVTPASTDPADVFTPATATTDQNGVATFSFSSTVAGDKTISATAGGVLLTDTEVITVFRRTSAIEITADTPDPSDPGQEVTVTFTVTGTGGGTPTGTVDIFSFSEAGVGCIGVTLVGGQGTCILTFMTSGDKPIGATYSGDSQFLDSFDTESHTVN
jgi:hypothetical protein